MKTLAEKLQRGIARGPRPNTWWKSSASMLDRQRVGMTALIPPAIYTAPAPVRQRLNDESFPGAKWRRHQKKGKSEAGSTKPGCRTNWVQRWTCRHNRSYRDSNYATTMLAIDKRARRVHTSETQGMGHRGIIRPHIASDFVNWLAIYMQNSPWHQYLSGGSI